MSEKFYIWNHRDEKALDPRSLKDLLYEVQFGNTRIDSETLFAEVLIAILDHIEEKEAQND